jgi:hypothetical protein
LSFVRSSRGEAYVAIRKDGLGIRLSARQDERVLSWESLDDVRPSDDQKEVIVLASGCEYALTGPFEGITVHDLTLRIRHARRLAVWNRLTRSALAPWC